MAEAASPTHSSSSSASTPSTTLPSDDDLQRSFGIYTAGDSSVNCHASAFCAACAKIGCDASLTKGPEGDENLVLERLTKRKRKRPDGGFEEEQVEREFFHLMCGFVMLSEQMEKEMETLSDLDHFKELLPDDQAHLLSIWERRSRVMATHKRLKLDEQKNKAPAEEEPEDKGWTVRAIKIVGNRPVNQLECHWWKCELVDTSVQETYGVMGVDGSEHAIPLVQHETLENAHQWLSQRLAVLESDDWLRVDKFPEESKPVEASPSARNCPIQ